MASPAEKWGSVVPGRRRRQQQQSTTTSRDRRRYAYILPANVTLEEATRLTHTKKHHTQRG